MPTNYSTNKNIHTKSVDDNKKQKTESNWNGRKQLEKLV